MSDITQVSTSLPIHSTRKLGLAWVALSLALAIHVADEALTGFLPVYNATVLDLRAKLGFWPMPTFQFREWLAGLIVAVLVLLALSPFVYRGSRWIRPVFYVFAILMISQRDGAYDGDHLWADREFRPVFSARTGVLFLAAVADRFYLGPSAVAAHPIDKRYRSVASAAFRGKLPSLVLPPQN